MCPPAESSQIQERAKDAAVVPLLNQDVLSNGATKSYLHVGAVSIRDCALSFLSHYLAL